MRLANQLSRGDVVLFTGAGFSLAAKNTLRQSIPSVNELRHSIWSLAFPDQELDDLSTLGDIYEVAARRAGNRLGQLLKDLFRVDPATLPECYRIWFSTPWYRAYTLNIDDLEDAAQAAFVLPTRIESISAMPGDLARTEGDLAMIHLNGRANDFPEVTFSPSQYGERAARHDPWYYHLVADLAGHPVLYVGTTLDEPLLLAAYRA